MEKPARATGAKIVTNVDDLTSKDLGTSGTIEERRLGDDKMVFIEGCKDPKSVAILIRAGLERLVDEAERALNDSLSVLAAVARDPRIVAGGGAVEIEVSKGIKDYASKVGGREQMAIESFAGALETIPRTLAENAGLDPIDIMVNLRAAHEKGEKWAGIDMFEGKIKDLYKEGVYEPAVVKEQVVKSAGEAANMILKIDDVIASSKTSGSPTPPGGGPPDGMGDE